MKQETIVHMLLTNKPYNLFVTSEDKLTFAELSSPPLFGLNELGWKPHHIYFITDEEIKEGDWIMRAFDRAILKDNINSDNRKGEKFWKIVATTNPELWRDEKYKEYRELVPSVAKIPLSFIKEYIEKQGKIEKVWLEYQRVETGRGVKDFELHPKLNSDGSVIILPNEEKSMKEVAWEAFKEGSAYDIAEREDFDEWFDKYFPK